MTRFIPRIAVTPGEPAGIGPDLVLAIASEPCEGQLVVIADRAMLTRRAELLGLTIQLRDFEPDTQPAASAPGELWVQHVPLAVEERAGELDLGNANYVLATLREACGGCQRGAFHAMLTGPVHKGVINDAGIAFSGHTEFLAELCGVTMPVMLLVADRLRVALVTTHLPLREVPDAIDANRVREVTRIVDADLRRLFGIERPRILVLGLNPHAGEGGHLGTEDDTIIVPVLDELRRNGLRLVGPLPADTAFTPQHLDAADAVLAMYHDQGLPVLKNRGFGRAVNVTLGLPIVRTSVDHGTALDLAGTGRADHGSLRAALDVAIELAARHAQ